MEVMKDGAPARAKKVTWMLQGSLWVKTVEEVVVQRVEQGQVVPCQVDMLTVVQRVGKIQQAVRTVEVVQGNAVERIVERMRPMIQEQGHVVERIVERKRPMIQEVDMVLWFSV